MVVFAPAVSKSFSLADGSDAAVHHDDGVGAEDRTVDIAGQHQPDAADDDLARLFARDGVCHGPVLVDDAATMRDGYACVA